MPILSTTLSRLVTLAGILFSLQYSIFLIHQNVWDRGIKIGCFAFLAMTLALTLSRRELARDSRHILFLYLWLFLAGISTSLFQADTSGIIQASKLFFGFLILPIFLLYWETNGACSTRFLTQLLVLIGLLLSIQSLILFTLIYFEWVASSDIVFLEKYNFMWERTYGILGYANAVQSVPGGARILRSQSWFLEPSLFAGFLICPAMIALAQARVHFTLFNCARFLIILLALFSTFSLAGLFGLVGAGIFWLAIPQRILARTMGGHTALKKRALFLLKLILVAVLFVVTVKSILALTHSLYTPEDLNPTVWQKVLGRESHFQKLLRSSSNLQGVIEAVVSRPFGLGFSHTAASNSLTSPNAVLFWAATGGIPGLIILFLLYRRLIFDHAIKLVLSKDVTGRALGSAFIGQTIHGLSYGNWLTPFYLLTIALMLWHAQRLKISSGGTTT